MVLRAGLIGLGMMGRNHARVMSSTDQVTLVGIADPIGDRAGNIDHSLLVESVPELIEIGIVVMVTSFTGRFSTVVIDTFSRCGMCLNYKSQYERILLLEEQKALSDAVQN